MSPESFVHRANLGERISAEQLPAGLAAPLGPGEAFAPVSLADLAALEDRSAATLTHAGVRAGDRVLLTLHADGDLTSGGLARALARLGATATCVDPRGRMRVLAVLRALRPRIWITTPQGAMDLLARLYLEFNVDPMELDLERICLVGEIASPGVHRRLEDEFESEIVDLYCDPFFGAALAQGTGGRLVPTDPATLALASIGEDQLLPGAVQDPVEGLAELVVRPVWSEAFAELSLRTGQVVGGEAALPFAHTIGEHLLARGRWLSMPLLRQALARIDGTVAWRVEVSRGDGTLDRVRVVVGFDRPTLVENRMWAGRAEQAVASVTPISFDLDVELVATEDAGQDRPSIGRVDDARGHHLACDRAEWAEAEG